MTAAAPSGTRLGETYYRPTTVSKLPIRWLAPELVQHVMDDPRKMVCTEKSDVWAYGITIMEIYSRGFPDPPRQPYATCLYKKGDDKGKPWATSKVVTQASRPSNGLFVIRLQPARPCCCIWSWVNLTRIHLMTLCCSLNSSPRPSSVGFGGRDNVHTPQAEGVSR